MHFVDETSVFYPSPAVTVYTRVEASFEPNKNNVTEIDQIVCDRCSVAQIYQLERCLFFKNNIIFHSFEAGSCVSTSEVTNTMVKI